MSLPASPSSIQDVTDEWPAISEIIETLTFRAGHNTNMVIAGTTLLGFAAGLIGVFALLRNRSLMTDALSHATLPGITLAFLILGAKSLPVLLLGATITGVLGVLCIQLLLRHTRLREDASIGIVLSVFFGAGIVGLSYIQVNAPSGSGGLNHFIYGQAATMQPRDVMLMGSIAIVAVIATIFLLKEFTIVCFNDAFARVDGWPVSFIDLLMMALVVVITVAGLQAVGLILVVSLLIIPPVAARFWTDRLPKLVIIAALIGACSGCTGSVVSALFPRKPAGAVIVLTAGILFVFSMFLAPRRGVIAIFYRRIRLHTKIAGDHLLEHAHDLGQSQITPSQFQNLARLHAWSKPYCFLIRTLLAREGMIVRDPLGGISLTESGIQRGSRVSRNHTLWEQYLVSYADIAPSHVDWSVDLVEHVLSEELIRELEAALRNRGISIPERSIVGGR